VNRLVSEFTESVYARQVAQLKTSNAAAFEVSALRAVVGQTRATWFAGRQRSHVGVEATDGDVERPDMPPARSRGVDEANPALRFDVLRERLVRAPRTCDSRNQAIQAERRWCWSAAGWCRPANELVRGERHQIKSGQFGVQLGMAVPVSTGPGGILSAAGPDRPVKRKRAVRIDLTRRSPTPSSRYETARSNSASTATRFCPIWCRRSAGVQRYLSSRTR